MTSITYNCLKCGHAMSRGFMVDTTKTHSQLEFRPSFWVHGEPVNEESIFGGQIPGLFDIDSQPKYMVRALRCDICGFLEHYAV